MPVTAVVPAFSTLMNQRCWPGTPTIVDGEGSGVTFTSLTSLSPGPSFIVHV